MSTTVLSLGRDGVVRPIESATVPLSRIAAGIAASRGIPIAHAQQIAASLAAGEEPKPLDRHAATVAFAQRHGMTYPEAQRALLRANAPPPPPPEETPAVRYGQEAMRDPRSAALRLSASRGIPLAHAQAVVARAIEAARVHMGADR